MSAASIRAALVSVGGAPAPVLFTLRRHRPGCVWYFCSAGSRPVADEIHRQLDWHPDRDFIEAAGFEELGPCYRELRQAIPALLQKWRMETGEVLVDYTGGTKTMSAALVLAATEIFTQFSYVGGEQREKGGLGVTVDGKERVFYQGNPWGELAVREVERCRDLWAGCQFDSVAAMLRETAAKTPRPLRFETVAEIAEGMAARHRLDFKTAVGLFGRAGKKIPAFFDGGDDFGLGGFAERARKICDECAKGTANGTFLRELLDNTLRTAGQHRYEDAAARLYRAMEMQGQIWLAEGTQDAFQNGRLRAGQALPSALATLPFGQADSRGEIKLSLEQVYLALHELGEARAAGVAADLALEQRSRWRQATEKRNSSILAHGVNAIGAEGFAVMKKLAAELLGFELDREENPVPALDPRWL